MIAHPKINMLVATGGPGVVDAVMKSGKKAIGASAGNPPTVVDASADIEKAAINIIKGASYDNNILCIAEIEIIVEEKVADYLRFCMEGSGMAYFIDDVELIDKLCAQVTVDGEAPNKAYVGRPVQKIMSDLGHPVDEKCKVVCMEVPFEHPFVQSELLMPVLPMVRVKNFEEAAEKAILAEHGLRHTATMHSRNIEHLSYLAKMIQTTIFVKNAPSYSGLGVGGEGYTSLTIAGATGEGITSAKDFTRKRRCVLVDAFNIK
jgi:propionaldehyde dehydrogenase